MQKNHKRRLCRRTTHAGLLELLSVFVRAAAVPFHESHGPQLLAQGCLADRIHSGSSSQPCLPSYGLLMYC